MDVVATGSDFVEVGRVLSPLFSRPALDGVQSEREDLLTLNQPGIRAVRSSDHPRYSALVLGWHPILEKGRYVRWLDDVVVDAHEHHVIDFHVSPSRRGSSHARVHVTLPTLSHSVLEF